MADQLIRRGAENWVTKVIYANKCIFCLPYFHLLGMCLHFVVSPWSFYLSFLKVSWVLVSFSWILFIAVMVVLWI